MAQLWKLMCNKHLQKNIFKILKNSIRDPRQIVAY
jgi:hypothetical protein